MSDLGFLSTLNQNQYEAANCTQGPLLVLAGAGTGKTKVLTSRIANIISQNLAKPYEILAVTFTNKAAREMSDRVKALIPCDGLNIGTFHAIAARMLRRDIHLFGTNLNSNFTIIDPDDQLKLIKNISLAQNIDIKIYAPKLIRSIISRWKDLNLLPLHLAESDKSLPAQRVAANIYTAYQQQLELANSLDFGDLLLYNNQLLAKNLEILEYYQNRFKYILIDEYQDTNASQYIWAKMLADGHKNICCVGDDDQSIYSWRGAEVANILRFEKDFPDAKVIKLEQNYRSSSQILHAASSIIKNNKNRHHKTLWTKKTGEMIKIVSCWNEKEEAKFVACEIEKSIKKGKYNANQIAVLVRAGFQTRAFEESFISNALPYNIIGGFKFYERAEIRDILAYIKLVLNNHNNLALERIINVPRRSVGNVTLTQIKELGVLHNLSLLDSLRELVEQKAFKAKTQEVLKTFVTQIDRWAEKYRNLSALDATKAILEESGYLDMLKEEKTEESRARIENINELLRAINEFNNIEEFIEHSSLVMDNETMEANFGGAISVMTLHASKGLEFDLVFLPGWEEGLFPHQKSISEEGDKGLEEERRIAYVGITRAKHEVYISYATSRWMFHEFIYSQPSRFLSEIAKEVCISSDGARSLNYLGSSNSVNMQSVKKPIAKISSDEVGSGKRVRHTAFGFGIVTKAVGDNLEIIFEGGGGIKNIKRSFVTPA
jgi:DNA helicase II / ATP-dependent DNA helicase PcrA